MLHIPKKEKYFFLFVFCLLLFLFLQHQFKRKRLQNDGIFSITKIVNIENMKNGQLYSSVYYYNGIRYSAKFKSIGLRQYIGDNLFINILKNDPKEYNILDFLEFKVPVCLDINNVPNQGWAKLPLDSCLSIDSNLLMKN